VVNRSFRRLLAATAVTGAALAAGVLAPPPDPAQSAPFDPNIIVVMTDDQTVAQTRVMRITAKRIRDRGTSFTWAFVSYPLCCPSRATFLTGRHSHNHGVLGNGTPVGGFDALDQENTLGDWLQNAGYRTIHVGKFLNGYGLSDPTYIPPGWSRWTGAIDDTANASYNYELNENGTVTAYGGQPGDYKSDVYTRKAIEEIEAAAPLAPAQPFFMFVGYTAPHLPANPAPRHKGRFAGRPVPRPASFNERDVSDKPRDIRRRNRFSARKVKRITANHRNQLRSLLAVDEGIGQIMDALAANDLLATTYVVFTSDNGFFTGEHRLPKGKFLPYEPSLRVPLMIRGPGLPAGERSEELVSNIDLAPTILSWAEDTPTVPVDGRSLGPFLADPGRRSRRPIFIEANTRDRPSPGIPYTGIRTDRWKLVRYRSGEIELYDLRRDPQELRSLHRSRRYTQTKRFLLRATARYADCVGAECRAPLGAVPGPSR
jgi:arylsulfatase A-like enzyme